MVMQPNQIAEILELYGLERILEDNQITLVEAIEILEELQFLDLEMYIHEQT